MNTLLAQFAIHSHQLFPERGTNLGLPLHPPFLPPSFNPCTSRWPGVRSSASSSSQGQGPRPTCPRLRTGASRMSEIHDARKNPRNSKSLIPKNVEGIIRRCTIASAKLKSNCFSSRCRPGKSEKRQTRLPRAGTHKTSVQSGAAAMDPGATWSTEE